MVLFICRFGTNGYQKSWGSVDDNFLGVGTVVGYVKETVAWEFWHLWVWNRNRRLLEELFLLHDNLLVKTHYENSAWNFRHLSVSKKAARKAGTTLSGRIKEQVHEISEVCNERLVEMLESATLGRYFIEKLNANFDICCLEEWDLVDTNCWLC